MSNRLRSNNEIKENFSKEKKSRPPRPRFRFLRKAATFLFGAGFLEDRRNEAVWRYLLFLSGLFMIYIAWGYRSEKLIRKVNALNKEINELRSEYIFTTGELMMLKKQSNLAEKTKSLGLKSSTTPPHIINTRSENLEKDE